jgi:membrane protein implicated in regulation of membrane protease activity
MDESLWWLMDIVGPAILLILLIWLAMRGRSNRTSRTTEQATDQVYAEEEKRRREGTDDL